MTDRQCEHEDKERGKPSKRYAVAVGLLSIECNHFGGMPTKIADFEACELLYGKDLLDRKTGVLGGMIKHLVQCDAQILPLLSASCCSRGPLTADCYQQLKYEFLERLKETPVDAVLLALHGAAASDGAKDLDGDLLEAIRKVIGPQVPLVATLDLHADVTERMIRNANALVAWETYPHNDSFNTGVRASRLLKDILEGRCDPVMVMAKVPVLVGATLGGTEGEGPFADIMRFAKAREGLGDIVSTSVFLVHPYIDMPKMGGGGLVITNGNEREAESLANEIARMYWERRFDLVPRVFTPKEAILRGMEIKGGPVLLVETADCCGGGAAGDSVATLKSLIDLEVDAPSLVTVVDPAAAAMCHEAGVGNTITLNLGHQLDPQWGKPVQVTGEVIRLSDGCFSYEGGMWDQQQGNMGATAVLKIGPLQALITSEASYDWADEQFRSVGLETNNTKFIVVKNPMNYRQAYGHVAKGSFILDTPGPTPATVRHIAYQNMQRPYFPVDEDIPNLQPMLICHQTNQAHDALAVDSRW